MSSLRRVATIESIGSSARIEGARLSDRQVEALLANIRIGAFVTRDEQEVAGYAMVMETIFRAYDAIPLTENHVRQLHRDLLVHPTKDEPFRRSAPPMRWTASPGRCRWRISSVARLRLRLLTG